MSELVYRVFEPSNEAVGEEIIILPNEIGASLDDYHGARAQHYADSLGSRVFAYERPYSASRSRYNFSLRKRMFDESVSVASDTARQIDSAISSEGASEIHIAGHSAGATEGVIVASTGIIPIERGFFTDPPGVRVSTPVKAEIIDYGVYSLWTEKRKPLLVGAQTETNTSPEIKPSSSEMTFRVLGELATHSRLWRSEVALKGLLRIIHEQREMNVDTIFPGNTFNANAQILEEVTARLNQVSRYYGSNMRTVYKPDMYHSYFDNYDNFIKEYKAVRKSK